MIRVQCRTNIDDYKGKDWPTKMICRPLKGDSVQASCGARLHVVGITHIVAPNDRWNSEDGGKPYLIVELHKYYDGLGGG